MEQKPRALPLFPKLASSLVSVVAGLMLAACGCLMTFAISGVTLGAFIVLSGCLRLALPLRTSRVSVMLRLLLTAAYVLLGRHIMMNFEAMYSLEDITKALLIFLFLIEGIQEIRSFAQIRTAGLVSAGDIRLLHAVQSLRGNGALLISGISQIGLLLPGFTGWPTPNLYDFHIWIGISLIFTGACHALFSATLRQFSQP